MVHKEVNQRYQHQTHKDGKQIRVIITGDLVITINYNAIVKYMGAGALANRNGKCVRGYVEVKAINRKVVNEFIPG